MTLRHKQQVLTRETPISDYTYHSGQRSVPGLVDRGQDIQVAVAALTAEILYQDVPGIGQRRIPIF